MRGDVQKQGRCAKGRGDHRVHDGDGGEVVGGEGDGEDGDGEGGGVEGSPSYKLAEVNRP